MAYNIQFKRATAARIAEVPNTVLLAGEPLLDTTNNRIYIGDGTTTLSNLKPIQNTQGVLDDMVTKGLLTATTTTTTETHNYTTDILQLDNDNSPQGFISAIDSTTAVCALDDSANGSNDFKINFKYPVTTGTLSSGDLESMVQVTTTNAGWGSISITWINNGVETTFYKYLGDMTQTLTREGPFQYKINSENNIIVFIDPQTTLKSVAIINNYYCNNTAVIRMTNATYEATESVTTYALNLPTATSSTLGMVKPDNTTIAVDANGVISANIPTPETVDQTYDATSTNAQSGIAIAGAGFMNGSIVRYPLQYQEDTTQSITLQNINSSTLTDTRKNGYWNRGTNHLWVYDINSERLVWLYSNLTTINDSNLAFCELPLSNGMNIAATLLYESSGGTIYAYILGKYVSNVFTPVGYLVSDQYGPTLGLFTTSSENLYSASMPGNIALSFYKAVNNTTAYIAGEYSTSGDKVTLSLSQEESNLLDSVTHIRAIALSSSSSNPGTIDLSTMRIINPNSTSVIVTDGNGPTRYNTFINGDNLLDVHPESLSLKYDSNTLGVNASNELTVPTATTSNKGLVQPDGTTITINNGVISAAGSTPSNMVTTDTSQNISGTKIFSVTTTNYTPTLKLKGYNSTGNNGDFISVNSNDYTSPAGVSIGYAFNLPAIKIFGGTSGSYSTFITYSGLYRNGGDTFTFWKNYAKNSKIVLKNYQDIIMDSSMLDGTYLTWDSTTNKITVDIQAIKDAIDALSNSSGSASTGNGDLEGGGFGT